MYIASKVSDSIHSLSSKFWTLVLFKLQKSNKKFGASLYQIYRTDTGHDFSWYFAYELLMILEAYVQTFFVFVSKLYLIIAEIDTKTTKLLGKSMERVLQARLQQRFWTLKLHT